MVVHNNHNAKNLVAFPCYQEVQILHLVFASFTHFHIPYAIATGNVELQGSMNSTLCVCLCVFKRTKLREETNGHLHMYPFIWKCSTISSLRTVWTVLKQWHCFYMSVSSTLLFLKYLWLLTEAVNTSSWHYLNLKCMSITPNLPLFFSLKHGDGETDPDANGQDQEKHTGQRYALFFTLNIFLKNSPSLKYSLKNTSGAWPLCSSL